MPEPTDAEKLDAIAEIAAGDLVGETPEAKLTDAKRRLTRIYEMAVTDWLGFREMRQN